MEHSDVESAEERQDWVEEVLRRWALKRAIGNGAQFARDVGVGQSSVSRFKVDGGGMCTLWTFARVNACVYVTVYASVDADIERIRSSSERIQLRQPAPASA